MSSAVLPVTSAASSASRSDSDTDTSTSSNTSQWLAFDGTQEMYNDLDLSECSLFAGGFINFGYWNSDVSLKKPLSEAERIESEKDLYRELAKRLSIISSDVLLEVGSGGGYGAHLLLKEFRPSNICGLDASLLQAQKANKIFESVKDQLVFKEGTAENIPFPGQSFDKIYSVEAAQHFHSIQKFTEESFRVLKPDGRLAITTFFANKDADLKRIPTLIDTAKPGPNGEIIDNFIPIDQMEKMLKVTGFTNINIESIGKHVWSGFDKWIAQGEFADTWDANWIRGYKEGLYDYYIVSAEKPSVAQKSNLQETV